MQIVSQSLPGQSLFTAGLRFALGAACVIVSFNLLAEESSSAHEIADGSAYPAIVEGDSGVTIERAVDRREARGADLQFESTGSPGVDRKGLKRALTDGGNPSGDERRRSMSAEERRALKRELRDAMRGANSSSLRVTPAANGPVSR